MSLSIAGPLRDAKVVRLDVAVRDPHRLEIRDGLEKVGSPPLEHVEVRPSGLVVHVNYTSWGWTLLAIGAALVLVGYGVAMGYTWARVTAVVLACLNAVVNLAFIAAYPVWALLVIALDVIVIYALVVHGREAKELRQ